jgi:hypothetical protein
VTPLFALSLQDARFCHPTSGSIAGEWLPDCLSPQPVERFKCNQGYWYPGSDGGSDINRAARRALIRLLVGYGPLTPGVIAAQVRGMNLRLARRD